MSRNKLIIVALLIVVALFFRVYRLSNVPPSPSLDEVSLGYNAYSMLHTGRDEFGTKWPLLLRAYDDYRPALYVYPVMVAINFLGLNAVAVRAPSALSSLVTLFVMFQIAHALGKKYLKSDVSAIWVLGFTSISAWHIYLSRLGHEVNLGLMLFTIGVYGLVSWAITDRKKSLYWGSIFLAFSLYAYQSEKAVVPVFIGLFGLIFWKRLTAQWKESLVAILIFIIVSSAAIIITASPEGMSRLRGTSAIGSDTYDVQKLTADHAAAVGRGDKFAAIYTSKYVIPVRIITSNYLKHFEPLWVFRGGQRENHKVPYTGLLYWWEAILLVIGVWYLYGRFPKKITALLAVWMFTGPIPAAITTQAPHAMRAFTMFPPLMLFVGFGAYALTKMKYKVVAWVVIIFLAITSAFQMGKNYFYTFPQEQSDSFEYSLGKAIVFAKQHENEYAHIVIANNGAAYQSYMFYLYYTQFDPARYLKMGGTISGGYAQGHEIGKYTFRELTNVQVLESQTLYIMDASTNLTMGRIIKTFSNLDRKEALIAVSL